MGQHLVKRLVRMLRLVDAYNLNLVKLVQTVKSADIFSIRTGLTTETSRICTILYRKILLVKYHVTEYIGYRHLGRRYKIKVVKIAMIHLSFLVGQLARTIA